MAQDLNSIIQTSPEPNTYYIKVDPQGTYLNTSYDFDVHVASSFELSDMFKDTTYPLKEGDLISLVSVGAFSYSAWISDSLVSDICAVFADYSNHPIKYGDLTTAPPCYTLATNNGNNSTDIPEDFQLNNFSTVYAQVPVGAKRIRFTVNDSYFSDNTDANGDLGIYIKLKVIRTDLSLGQLIFPNAKPDINDGLPVVQIGVPTQMNVPVSINSSGPITSDVLNASVPIALQIGSQLYTQYISISTLAANQNYMVVPFTVTFKPEDAGLSTVTATINASEALKETNYTNNKVQRQVHVRYQYKIKKTISILNKKTESEVNNPDFFQMRPTIDTRGTQCKYNYTPSRIRIKIECQKDDETSENVEGCQIQMNKYLGNFVGGHFSSLHDVSERPLGKFIKNGQQLDINKKYYQIPIDGLTFGYEAPEHAGEIEFSFYAYDPYDNQIEVTQSIAQVKINGLIRLLGIPHLRMIDTGHLNQDGSEGGVYATPTCRQKITDAIGQYYKSCIKAGIPEDQIIPLRSEAASLVWGGLYDKDFDWFPSHCGHRVGDAIDIGMGPFRASQSSYKKKMKLLLQEALLNGKSLYFPVPSESPTGKKHWHTQLK